MRLLECSAYAEDVRRAAECPLEWDKLRGSSVLLCGAGGMIGSFLVDTLIHRNREHQLGCRIYAAGRSRERLEERFKEYLGGPLFEIVTGDVSDDIQWDFPVGYIIHAASNTHPMAYSTDPVGTLTANVIGTDNLLKYAVKHMSGRFVFVSTVEVYGENRGDTEAFSEDYCGYIDCNTVRACYNEGKRAGEALCQAYIKQFGVDCVIPRLPRVYGPTMLMSDSKASSQFIKNAVNGEDIVLKSPGEQLFSYVYVADAATGLLKCMLSGEMGQAYNITGVDSDVRLKQLAQLAASAAGKTVVFELPDKTESAGYSKASVAVLNGEKLRGLGWQPQYTMADGISRTVEILTELKKGK